MAKYAVVSALLSAIVLGMGVGTASAHRSGCHRWHSCPSDLYTYRWHGLLCSSHQTDKIKIVFQGRMYWCHR
jgi:hypothetical protein